MLDHNAMDELEQLRSDYLADVRAKALEIRAQGRGEFKDAFPRLLFLAHQLKGSGGALGFPRITDVARRMTDELTRFLDDEVAARPTPEMIAASLDALSRELEREAAQ